MTDEQARARMQELKAAWQAYCAERAMHLRIPVGDISKMCSNMLHELYEKKFMKEIVEGDLNAQDCGHQKRLVTAFMDWLETFHRAEWKVVATWCWEEYRYEDADEHASFLANQDPHRWDWEEVSLVDDMLARN
jgi:hypothetical protein